MSETISPISPEPPLAKPYQKRLGERFADAYTALTNSYTHEAIDGYSQKYRKELQPTIDDIKDAVEVYKDITLDEIKDEIADLHLEGATEEELEEALPTVFALFHHALRLTQDGHTPYKTQVESALTMHDGQLAEMRTSEGKTYAIAAAATLNALTKKGVYVVTADTYLACRDLANLGRTYEALGLKVAVITDQKDEKGEPLQYIYDSSHPGDHPDPDSPHLRRITRAEAYQAEITIGIPSEFIFDYLDDRSRPFKIQRPMNCALIDEAHNTLIEQAIQPFIESQKEELTPESRNLLMVANKLPLYLSRAPEDSPTDNDEPTQGEYFITHPEDKVAATINLTDTGYQYVSNLCRMWGLDYEDPEVRLAMENAMKAHLLWQKDKPGGYIVTENGEITLTHPQTGRPMTGVRLTNSLHQALEAKEYVRIQPDNIITDSITAMQYFKMFPKLGATTGTAEDYAEIFSYFYDLHTVIIPTRNPIRMKRFQTRGISYYDEDRIVTKSEDQQIRIPGLFHVLAEDARKDFEQGRPILIGLAPGNVAKADALGEYFRQAFAQEIAEGKLHLQVIHAKQDAQEHKVVNEMGRTGYITIAAGYAALGADPKLGETKEGHDKINDSGGLAIYAIDVPELQAPLKQLIGRGGRTGDNGSWRLYVTRDSQLLSSISEEQLQQLADDWGLRGNKQAQAYDPDFAARLDAMIERIQRANVSKLMDTLDQNLRLQEVIDLSRAQFDERIDYLRAHPLLVPRVIAESVKEVIDNHFPNYEDFPPSGEDQEFFESLVADVEAFLPNLTDDEFDHIFDMEQFALDENSYKKHIAEIALERFNQKARKHGSTPEEIFIWQYNLYMQAVSEIWHDHRNTIQNILSTIQIARIPRPMDELARRLPQELKKSFTDLRYHLTHLALTPDEEEPTSEESQPILRLPHDVEDSLPTNSSDQINLMVSLVPATPSQEDSDITP